MDLFGSILFRVHSASWICSWLWTSRLEVPRQSAFCFPPFIVFLWLFAVLCPGIFTVRGRTWKMWVHGKGLFPSQLPYPQPHSQWKPALQNNAQTHALTSMTSVNWVHVSDFPMKCSQARDLFHSFWCIQHIALDLAFRKHSVNLWTDVLNSSEYKVTMLYLVGLGRQEIIVSDGDQPLGGEVASGVW